MAHVHVSLQPADHDWASTPLGPLADWPQSLRTVADIVFDSPLAMVVLWGPDLIQVYNDGYALIAGAKHPAALGQRTQDCWPEVWAFNEPIYRDVLSGRSRSFRQQPLALERSGVAEPGWFDLTYSPVRDEAGAPVGVLVTVVETTARVLADRSLAMERERQRQQFEQAPGFICVSTGPDHVYDFGNDAYARLIGSADFLGRTAREARPDLPGQDFADLLDRVYRTGRRLVVPHTPVRIPRPGSATPEERFIDFTYAPVIDEDGQVFGIFTQGHDVTDAHLAQTALLEGDTRLRALNAELESRVMEIARERSRIWALSPELLGVLTPDGVFESCNPAWNATLGWHAEEVMSRPIFDFIHPEDQALARDGFAAPRADQPTLGFEIRCREKSGRYRWISWVGVREGARLYASGRDITTEKEQALELARTQDHLRQSHKLEAIGQLTGGVAHDFNNLLTIIRYSVDFLRRGDLTDSRRTRYVDAISDTVTRATTLTSQLLAFARRQPLEPTVFEVNERTRGVVELIRPLMGNQIEVDCDLDGAHIFAKADVSQFETALVNLAVNARDAMDGVGKVMFEVRIDGDFIAVSIRDTGAGIPAAMIDSIFEPFFTTKDVGKGTGLGLSQVFGFAKQSGGEMDVESVEGRGSRFTIFLPRAAALGPDPAAAVGADPDPATGAGLRILVVEDNKTVGGFVVEMLIDLGFEPRWVEDAVAALDALSEDEGAFDVVFSDVVMPGMTGLEMAARIRDRLPGLPVILTSGYSEVIAREGHGGFELLQKPYSVDALSRVLRKATQGARRVTA